MTCGILPDQFPKYSCFDIHVILVYNEKPHSSIRTDGNTNFEISQADFSTKDSIILAKYSIIFTKRYGHLQKIVLDLQKRICILDATLIMFLPGLLLGQ